LRDRESESQSGRGEMNITFLLFSQFSAALGCLSRSFFVLLAQNSREPLCRAMIIYLGRKVVSRYLTVFFTCPSFFSVRLDNTGINNDVFHLNHSPMCGRTILICLSKRRNIELTSTWYRITTDITTPYAVIKHKQQCKMHVPLIMIKHIQYNALYAFFVLGFSRSMLRDAWTSGEILESKHIY
jgi:2-succinyl-5-enolpyruvyl-6-hydroxy-3-cyclohexene-1-carboxylate synthase